MASVDTPLTSVPNETAAPVLALDAGDAPYADKMTRAEYEAQKAALLVELLKVQLWVQETDQKLVLLFERRASDGIAQDAEG